MGGKSKAPNFDSLAAASQEAAQIMYGLGQQQLDESKRQYDLAFPFVQRIAQGQYDIMKQTADQGQDYFDYMKSTFRPVEQQMVREALDYNTEAKREELAQQAAADAGLAFQRTQAANERAMASMGANPNSGRFAGLQRASELGLAAQRANAMTGTRRQAESLGYARMADAAGMGRGLPGASSGAYQVATGAGSSAVHNFQSPGQNYMAGMGQGANTIGSGQQMYLNGLGNALNGQASIYNNKSDPLATIAGFGSMMLLSTKDAKTKTGEVNAQAVSKAVESLPVDAWRYKPGQGDGGAATHVGAYAEDMAKLGAATPDGRAIDVISALGLNLAAAKGLGQRVAKLEQRVGSKQHA
jgi:hypothetical protein